MAVPTKATWSWSGGSSLNPLGGDRQTAKRAVQRKVGLPHQPEISAADEEAIRFEFGAFTHLEVIDPDQWDVVALTGFFAEFGQSSILLIGTVGDLNLPETPDRFAGEDAIAVDPE